MIALVRYKTVDAEGDTDLITTVMLDEMPRGAMAAPSLAAHVARSNVGKGLPLFRIEDSFAREGDPARQSECRGCVRHMDSLPVPSTIVSPQSNDVSQAGRLTEGL